MEVVRQLEMRVKVQLEEIVIFISESWKLVAVKAEKVNGENLVEVARIVRKWLDEYPQTNTADVVRGKTDRDLDILCSSLEMVAARLGAHFGSSPLLPLGGDLSALRLSLQAELPSSSSSKSNSAVSQLPASSAPASVLRSAWRALSGQLDLVRRKQEEFRVLRKELLAP